MNFTKEKKKFLFAVRVTVSFISILWIIHFLQVISGVELGYFGLYPRRVFGLRGILFAPLIHSNLQHLMSNSAPLIVLTLMIFYFFRKVAFQSFAMIYVLTGFSVWLFARPVFHVGASGVVYGMVSFIFWTGIFTRNLKSIVLALIVTILYSGITTGILPNQQGISWESHLLGALVGIFTAFWYKGIIKEEETKYHDFIEEEEKQYFLERDIFEKTKEERKRENDSEWFSSST